MRWVLDAVGLVLFLLGGLWILQGTGVLAMGFMAGHIQYAVFGAVVAIIGIALIVYGNLRPRVTSAARRSDSSH